jgi:hypothetical protein
MRFYVHCKSNPQELIYVSFENKPVTRQDIPVNFSLKCRNGQIANYTNRDVFAEIGTEPLVGGLLGGLFFLIDPLIGLGAAIAALVGTGIKEADKVKKFNES